MKVEIIPEVGDIFEINLDKKYGFAFSNKGGGTGMSNWEYDNKYTHNVAKVKITKVWYDDETGYRCWGEPVNAELKEYLNEVSSKQVVYVSQFDLKIA